MVLSRDDAERFGKELLDIQTAERAELDVVRQYQTSKQPLPAIIPAAAPSEVHVMARTSRVPVIAIVVESITQGLFVDGIRPDADTPGSEEAAKRAWDIWTRNGMDSRQTGLVRATTAYGTGYNVVLPGSPVPLIRSASPRQLTALYGDDDVWPVRALQRMPRSGRFRLYDNEAVYDMVREDDGLTAVGNPREHRAGVCPVVRFLDAVDLDRDDEVEGAGLAGGRITPPTSIVAGQVAPLIDLQDQINLTSFALKAAEWYSAFRQRWIVGWTGSATDKQKAGASQLWTFDEDPTQLQIGEFQQTELRGYLDSRAEAMKFAATLSQTPVHELTGQLVNLSAEALAAAEIGRDRKVDERKTVQGEAHEQTLQLAARLAGFVLPESVEVIWRDTSARAFAAVVDGLGKLATMLGVPPSELWDRIPGVTKQDVDRFRKAAEEGDSIGQLTAALDRQAGGGAPGTERTTAGGIILPRGVTV